MPWHSRNATFLSRSRTKTRSGGTVSRCRHTTVAPVTQHTAPPVRQDILSST